jgi:methylenetetrahydrofolate--tRNA-(uracil-5-)-methyltransferase
MQKHINIIGAGLAGCEAAYQIAKQKIQVKLYDMKPLKFSKAHNNSNLAEIVCSNSFKSNEITNACRITKRRTKNVRFINNKMCR